MDIQRKRPIGLPAATQGVQQIERPQLAAELERSRVGHVSRRNLIVTMDQIGIPANGVEHLTFSVECGDGILGCTPLRRLDLYQASPVRQGCRD